MAEEHETFVPLTRSGNPVQQSLIRDVLAEAGIPFLGLEGMGSVAALAPVSPINYVEFRVPPERVQEAKDLLCSSGVICDVSERLLRRSLEEVVKPLLAHPRPSRDLERLLYLARINNKETVTALYEATRDLKGGIDLLVDLFFEMARTGEGHPLLLARALAGTLTAEFAERFLQEATGGDKEARLALLDVAPAFRGTAGWLLESVAAGLLDSDEEIRDAAGEALFALEGDDYGYDPKGPQKDREAAVARLVKAKHLDLGPRD